MQKKFSPFSNISLNNSVLKHHLWLAVWVWTSQTFTYLLILLAVIRTCIALGRCYTLFLLNVQVLMFLMKDLEKVLLIFSQNIMPELKTIEQSCPISNFVYFVFCVLDLLLALMFFIYYTFSFMHLVFN